MTRGPVILAVISALFLGLSLGFMSGILFSRHLVDGESRWGMGFGGWGHASRAFRHAPPGSGGMPSPGRLVSHLQRLLDLTPAQADAIRAEVKRSRGDFGLVRDSLHARIERHLTAEQRQRWRVVVRERIPGDSRGLDPHTLRAEPGREGESTR